MVGSEIRETGGGARPFCGRPTVVDAVDKTHRSQQARSRSFEEFAKKLKGANEI